MKFSSRHAETSKMVPVTEMKSIFVSTMNIRPGEDTINVEFVSCEGMEIKN